MPQYILFCNHPHVEDTDPDPDESYYEIVYKRVEHPVPADDDESALRWAESHAKKVIRFLDKEGNPLPFRLVEVLRQW